VVVHGNLLHIGTITSSRIKRTVCICPLCQSLHEADAGSSTRQLAIMMYLVQLNLRAHCLEVRFKWIVDGLSAGRTELRNQDGYKKPKNTKYDYYKQLYQCETAFCFHVLHRYSGRRGSLFLSSYYRPNPGQYLT